MLEKKTTAIYKMTQRVSIVLAKFGHYAKGVQQWLQQENIRILKKKHKTINNINQFKRGFERAPSTVEISTVQKMLKPIERKVMAFDRDKLELSTFITKRIKNDIDI